MNNYKPHLTDECLLEKLNQIIDEGCGDLGDLLILRLYHKVMALEDALTFNLKKVKGSSYPLKPDSCLVESVASVISDKKNFEAVNAWKPEARAAIRVVAAALMEWYDSDQLVLTALDAAKWLEQEAER
jgi:hypothetical protein